MATREAACHCGQLRLKVAGDPFVVSICHCLACQRRTGSAFGMQAAFKADQVQVAGRFSDFAVDRWEGCRDMAKEDSDFDGEGEDSLVGSRVTLGEATLDVAMRIERCMMTTRAQAGGIERDLDVLRTIARERDACLAVGAVVIDQGTTRVGDTLEAS